MPVPGARCRSVNVSHPCHTTAAMLRMPAQFAAAQHLDCRAHLGRQAAVEGDDQQAPRTVAYLDQAARFCCRHHHRLFQQHIDTGFQAQGGLIVVIGMRRNDKHGVQFAGMRLQQTRERRLIGRWLQSAHRGKARRTARTPVGTVHTPPPHVSYPGGARSGRR